MNPIKITQSITNRDEISNIFFGQINKYKALSQAEEMTCAMNLHTKGVVGEEARKMLIVSNIRFAISIAKKYMNFGLSMNDLIDEACVGLCRACDTFDPTRNCRFITHAVSYIRASIIEALEKNGRMITTTHEICQLQGKYRHLCDETFAKEGRMPTDVEFAEYANISPEKAQLVLANIEDALSLDCPMGTEDGDEFTLYNTFVGGAIDEGCIDNDICRSTLESSLYEILSERDAKAVMAYFGLSQTSLNEIALLYGTTYDTLHKAVKRAIQRIQDNKKIMERLMVFREAA